MQTILAFLNGIREFRLICTTSYDDDDLTLAYDRGRELAHHLTFRHFEPA
ncbi:hypothetical protein I5588_27785 [Burkholderia multivorans]|nr:hypothetical protein [Burkholderia multivorans]MBJ9658329.1 hypothetical protein [Burkholderia multivorans]